MVLSWRHHFINKEGMGKGAKCSTFAGHCILKYLLALRPMGEHSTADISLPVYISMYLTGALQKQAILLKEKTCFRYI
jgi:hypothetical protein